MLKMQLHNARVLLIGMLLLATGCPLGDTNYRKTRNENSARSRLLVIHTLQSRFASAHPNLGYSCSLSQLSPSEAVDGWESQADLTVLRTLLNTGVNQGYRFEIRSCRPDERGIVSHYEVTAVPMAPGGTGVRAFCINEMGSVWSDPKGSVEECLASHRP